MHKKVDLKTKYMIAVTIIMFLVMVVLLSLVYVFHVDGKNGNTGYTTYDQYYVMISNDKRSSFMSNVYEGAYKEGIKQGIFVDSLADNLPNDYTEADLIKIAISSQVDGIIVDAEISDEITELINQANDEGIPVVTLLNDNTDSKRCCFVGIGGYEIGREYGSEVLQIAKELRRQYFMSTQDAREEEIASIDVAVLVNSTNNSASQNVIISGIRETIETSDQNQATTANVEIISVDNSSTFSVEESIRDIFIDNKRPDVIICLDELTTTCVYQAVVDYNVVGKVNILGYYDSDTILNAIDRGVIYSSVTVDTDQLGAYCVDALKDYNEFGTTSQYYTGDIALINRSNVASYLTKEEQNHE